MRAIILAAVLAASAVAAPASAVSNFTTDFDDPVVPGGFGQATVSSIQGWSNPNGVIVHAGGFQGDADTPPNYVELTGGLNNSISRTIDAGVYTLTWNYSVHPGEETSNPIAVFVNGVQKDSTDLGDLTLDNTLWFTSQTLFTVSAPTTLSFRATGTSDQAGGYLDSLSLVGTALPVPEPGEWAMLVAGLGVIGAAASRRRI